MGVFFFNLKKKEENPLVKRAHEHYERVEQSLERIATADIALTVFVDFLRWHTRSFLILSKDQFRQIADDLSGLFEYENTA
jgi:hypothetical protein